MSLLFRRETRSLSYQDVFGSGGSLEVLGSGLAGAARLVPLFACWRIISDQFASTPLLGYRDGPDGTRVRMGTPPPLLRSPSAWDLTPFAWKHKAALSALAHGNAVGMATAVDATGWPTGLEWLNPSLMACDDEPDETPRFWYRGREVYLWSKTRAPGSIVHIPWVAPPGRAWGLSPLGLFKTQIETGHYAGITARDWFKNGALPNSHLKNTAKKLDKGEATVAKDLYMEAVSDRSPFVSGMDWDLTPIGVPPDQAQFIETLKLGASEFAAIYGLPPEKVGGEAANSLTYATREQNALDLRQFAMVPWFARFEEGITALMPRPQSARFDADAMTRADLKTRMESHALALASGVETVTEARRAEDRPPLTEAERDEWINVWKRPADQPAQKR